MYHTEMSTAVRPAEIDAEIEEAPLMRFDRIRALLVLTRLPPRPDVYDLFWRCLGGDDVALGVVLDAAIVERRLDLAAVATMRAMHCSTPGLAACRPASPQ
ncbi:hypothetical protein [Polymorphobacter megasporae]|uniref:hypothetical protein n=1 Tax=Glacieibacterium megasporae TaxID=2835787 RepID=UPI001C1DFC31|nr:hypothetical protein [Polymorphobacter megasporae]UAJ10296.1 hypothetical protein KTC28_00540 [Polymorphobacter megasporae]